MLIETLAEHVCRGIRVSGDTGSVWSLLRAWWMALDTAGPAAKTAAVIQVSSSSGVPRETMYDWRRRFRRGLHAVLRNSSLEHRQHFYRHLQETVPQSLRHQSLELLLVFAHASARRLPSEELHLCGRILVNAAAVAMEGWITGCEFASETLRRIYDLIQIPQRTWEPRIPLSVQLAQAGLDCLRALPVRDVEWEAYAHASSAHAYDQAAMPRLTKRTCRELKGLERTAQSEVEQRGLAPHLEAGAGLLRKLSGFCCAERSRSERVDRFQAVESEHATRPPPGYHLGFGLEHKRVNDMRLRVRLLLGEAEYCLALRLPDLALEKLHSARGMIDDEYIAGLGRHCRLLVTAQAQLGIPRLDDAIEQAEVLLNRNPYQRSLVRALADPRKTIRSRSGHSSSH